MSTQSNCTFDRRRRVCRLKHDLESFDVVRDVDVLAPHEGQHREWTVSAIVVGDSIPPLVLEAIEHRGCSLLPDATGTRGEPTVVEVVARS